MKKLFSIVAIVLIISSCKNSDDKNKFTVSGEIKNVPNQTIFLEEVFFGPKDPEIVDSAEVKSGKFQLSTLASEEGLYRLRLGTTKTFFLLVNDKPDITFSTDINNVSLDNISVNTPANQSFKNFLKIAGDKKAEVNELTIQLKAQKERKDSDSIIAITKTQLQEKDSLLKNAITVYADTVSSPIVSMFVLDYFSQQLDMAQIEKIATGMAKRFPQHQGAKMLSDKYLQMAMQYKRTPHTGDMAPELVMNDTTGKPFALSSLRGKYVLVDFWASWCGPCRQENPNVVVAYNTYKDKGFTVLGVSLDKSKEPWVNAIKKDNLTWTHISDLKEWESAAISIYGFGEIPYNVLVDPQGKIIATGLRGEALQAKLADILK